MLVRTLLPFHTSRGVLPQLLWTKQQCGYTKRVPAHLVSTLCLCVTRFASEDEYLKILYSLLRADCFMPLSRGVALLRGAGKLDRSLQSCVFHDVVLIKVCTMRQLRYCARKLHAFWWLLQPSLCLTGLYLCKRYESLPPPWAFKSHNVLMYLGYWFAPSLAQVAIDEHGVDLTLRVPLKCLSKLGGQLRFGSLLCLCVDKTCQHPVWATVHDREVMRSACPGFWGSLGGHGATAAQDPARAAAPRSLPHKLVARVQPARALASHAFALLLPFVPAFGDRR
jgi:hypothetical protein